MIRSTMERFRRIFPLTMGLTIVVLLIFLAWLGVSRRRTAESPVSQELKSAVAKTETFVKNHVTGGVGAALTIDGTTGLPRIVSVLPGSPAETAGLCQGDTILRVNEVPTAGLVLAKVVDSIRGFSAGEVSVTVQRMNSTNLTFTIHRASWSALGVPGPTGAGASPSAGIPTNYSVVIQSGGIVFTNIVITNQTFQPAGRTNPGIMIR